MGMLPGAMQAKAAMSKAKIDEKQLKRQEAIILVDDAEGAPQPRRVQVQEINKLLKQHHGECRGC
jgi:signal recognition particle subunit SRP54